MGLIFEQMCREYLFLYAEDVPVVLSDIGSWWGTDSKEKKEVEIDIVGTPVEGNEYIIGSCKYKNSPVGVDELELLKHYADVFGKEMCIRDRSRVGWSPLAFLLRMSISLNGRRPFLCSVRAFKSLKKDWMTS